MGPEVIEGGDPRIGRMQRNLKRVMGLGRKRVETIKEVGITVKEEKERGKSQRNLKRARIKMTEKEKRKQGTIMMEVVVRKVVVKKGGKKGGKNSENPGNKRNS